LVRLASALLFFFIGGLGMGVSTAYPLVFLLVGLANAEKSSCSDWVVSGSSSMALETA